MSRSIRQMSRYPVVSARGKRVGRIQDVLVRPDRNEVVGYVVARPRFLYILDRKDRYLAHDRITVANDVALVSSGRDAWDGEAAKRLGITWQNTVIWYGMPVKTESGTKLGVVRDGLFDAVTGEIEAIGLTGGITADVAVGVRDIPGRLVVGYRGEAVVVRDEAGRIDTTGGAAKAAGKQAAVAQAQAAEAARAAADAARTAAKYGRAAAKAAAGSDAGKKAVGWFKALRDEVVDAMGDPDDDD